MTQTRHILTTAILVLFTFSCAIDSNNSNPPSEGFDQTGSDAKAVALADEVMAACGGRSNWDKARYFTWVFADSRKHYWDKSTGDIRIESQKDSSIYLMNVHTKQGRIRRNGQEITDEKLLQAGLEKGYGLWVNDSYWLVMPFKMKDSGVTLKYVGEQPTADGKPADVVAMTFKEVGLTPKNKYHVFVDKESKLVTQWSFFNEAERDTASFTMPWRNYQTYSSLRLSDDRERLQLSEIAVDPQLQEGIFTKFD